MRLKARIKQNAKPVWIRFLLIIGIATLLTRLALDSRFGTSALFYCLVPYTIGIILFLFVPQPQGYSKPQRFARHMLSASVVMLASSAILFEGFLCVIMAAPIYLIFAGLAFAIGPKHPGYEPKNVGDVFRVSAVPLLVALLSLEGLTDTTSFPREEVITRSAIVNLSPAEIHANLAQPVHMDAERSAFLSLFPLPDRVETGGFAQGQTHKAFFTYRRWGWWNVHKGETHLHMKTVEPLRIETEVTRDDSYFSHYLTVHGTRIDLAPQADGRTEVTLTLRYRRDLDPAWYFGPMQRRAMGESAEYLIANVIGKDSP